ncbi:related to 8-amino-7-oxononanoate synthase [Melanopsichium pennsylvanicum]|uniref:Related to 8-amino-7-oxononanoate synthase n=2 Tax=Melanopsichium pennsylvanicum TaxID=63383 RepID=A0AAJ4XIC9_9BASI|nr:related to 8-amino-7-oxononanoate synthase [Melanopsichium pennsylvanicum 4]SNX82587.1 related to 8-amino-7-oxononanoate synthase [Melanopsichium pennsylvanicum]
MALDGELQKVLDARAAKGTLRQLTVYPTVPSSSSFPSSSPAALIDFSSNDYLSLATSSRVRADFVSLVTSNTLLSSQLGSAGSRLLDGNSSIHETIENELTQHFASSTAGLLFNSGYEANVSLLSTLPQPTDVVLYDELVHASVHDGLRRSRVPTHLKIPFRHSSAEHLETVLKRLTRDGSLTACTTTTTTTSSSTSGQGRNIWLAVESVYSMDGDVCPLKSLLDIMSKYIPNNRICAVIDEAHSTALYGFQGRGLVNALNLQNDARITARLMTFGKAWGASGAIVLCSKIARHYLINYARPLIFSTALGYPQLASIVASFRSIQDGSAEIKARKTFGNSRRLVDGIEDVIQKQKVGSNKSVALPPHLRPKRTEVVGEDDLVRWSMQQPSPIIPLLTDRARQLAAHLRQNGLLARSICYPTVPKGEDRVRICVHADNTSEDIDRLIECVRRWIGDDAMEHGGGRTMESGTAPLLASKL